MCTKFRHMEPLLSVMFSLGKRTFKRNENRVNSRKDVHPVHTYGACRLHNCSGPCITLWKHIQMRGEYIGLMFQVHNGVVGPALFSMSTEHLLYPFGFPGWFQRTLASGYAWSLLLMFQSSQRKIHSIIKTFTSMSTMMWPSIQDHTWKSAMCRQSYQTQNYSKHHQMCLIVRVDHSHLLILVSFQSQNLSWVKLATEWVV